MDRGLYTSRCLIPFVSIVQLAVDPASEDRLEGAYHEGTEDCVLSIRGLGRSMIAKEGVVGSSRKEDEVLAAGL